MDEIFRDIPTYEGLYQVSNLGNIKSLLRTANHFRGGKRIVQEKQLKVGIDKNGYFHVCLCKNNKLKTIRVHQLVAIAFLNHMPDGHKLVIDHKNDDKSDNRLENLQIVTNRFNSRKKQGSYSSKYKGVCWSKHANKWLANIDIKGKTKHLGLFNTELEASEAYQNKLKEII